MAGSDAKERILYPLGLLLVCCALLAACSAGSAASSPPPSGVALAGTFTDDSFQASDYYGNACSIFEHDGCRRGVHEYGGGGRSEVGFWGACVRVVPGDLVGERS